VRSAAGAEEQRLGRRQGEISSKHFVGCTGLQLLASWGRRGAGVLRASAVMPMSPGVLAEVCAASGPLFKLRIFSQHLSFLAPARCTSLFYEHRASVIVLLGYQAWLVRIMEGGVRLFLYAGATGRGAGGGRGMQDARHRRPLTRRVLAASEQILLFWIAGCPMSGCLLLASYFSQDLCMTSLFQATLCRIAQPLGISQL
jgi:hypothetical protein